MQLHRDQAERRTELHVGAPVASRERMNLQRYRAQLFRRATWLFLAAVLVMLILLFVIWL